MFIVSKKADEVTFWAEVTVWAPATNPGASRGKHDFDIQFKLIDTKQDDNQPNDLDWFREHVVGWKRVVDDAKQDLQFCAENLEAVYALEWTRLPIVQAYYREVSGTAQRKKTDGRRALVGARRKAGGNGGQAVRRRVEGGGRPRRLRRTEGAGEAVGGAGHPGGRRKAGLPGAAGLLERGAVVLRLGDAMGLGRCRAYRGGTHRVALRGGGGHGVSVEDRRHAIALRRSPHHGDAALNELAAVAREEAERMERESETPKKARKRKRGK